MSTVLFIVLVLGAGGAHAPATDEQQHRQALERYRAGQDLMAREAFEEAARKFSEAVKLDPLLTLAHYRLGQAYMAMKSYPQAVQAFVGCRDAYRGLIDLQATDVEAVERRRDEEITELQNEIQLIKSGQYKTTNPNLVQQRETRIHELERTRRRQTPDLQIPAEISLSLGSAYFRTGAVPDAEREFRAAIAANPKLGEAHNNLAVVYMLSGRLDDAEQEVNQAERAGYRVHPQFKEDLKKAHRQSQTKK